MQPPGPGAVEFTEKDALPGAQEQAALTHQNGLVAADEGGLDVGRGIALQVAVGLLVWDDLIQDHEDVRLDAGVGAFVDGHPCGGF